MSVKVVAAGMGVIDIAPIEGMEDISIGTVDFLRDFAPDEPLTVEWLRERLDESKGNESLEAELLKSIRNYSVM